MKITHWYKVTYDEYLDVISTSKFRKALSVASRIMTGSHGEWKAVSCDLEHGIIRRWKGVYKSGRIKYIEIKRES